MGDENAQNKPSGAGFFHIDRRVWNAVCDRKNVNQAAAYLCIAAGTGAGNRASRWSAQAIETYTGQHWKRAKEAIKILIDAGFIALGEDSSYARPHYELQGFEAVLETIRSARDWFDAGVFADVRAGRKLSKADRARADKLVAEGLLFISSAGYSCSPPSNSSAGELIWLPNTLVTGSSKGEASPVRRLRSSGDIWALRFLVNLYQVQNLSADGGISRNVLRYEYERKHYGERGNHVVWGFKEKSGWADPHPITSVFWTRKQVEGLSENPIWPATRLLWDMGLLQAVPHLVENSSNDSEPIHAFGWNGIGETIEQQLGTAADEAGRYMIGEQRLYAAESDGIQMLAPAYKTQRDVQMVGIYRLTYRPRTKLTADWMRRTNESAKAWLGVYSRLSPTASLPIASGM